MTPKFHCFDRHLSFGSERVSYPPNVNNDRITCSIGAPTSKGGAAVEASPPQRSFCAPANACLASFTVSSSSSYPYMAGGRKQ